MVKALGTINFIPQEVFRKLQLMANVVTTRAYEKGLLTDKEEFTARTLAYEILRLSTPNDCEHTRFRKFNSSLYTCKGCFGLFEHKDGVYRGPVNILELYDRLNEIHKIRKQAEAIEQDARSENRKRLEQMDIEYYGPEEYARKKNALLASESDG